jgi:FtsZ-binding cell division protein ZapB
MAYTKKLPYNNSNPDIILILHNVGLIDDKYLPAFFQYRLDIDKLTNIFKVDSVEVTNLKNEIKSLSNAYSDLQDKFDNLQENYDAMRGDMSDMKTENSRLVNKIRSLQFDNDKLMMQANNKITISNLEYQLRCALQEKTNLKSRISRLEWDIQNANDDIYFLRLENKRLSDLANNSKSARVETDPYIILGISRNTPKESIRTLYRKLSLIYHPDRGDKVNYEVFTEKFKVLSNAYHKII